MLSTHLELYGPMMQRILKIGYNIISEMTLSTPNITPLRRFHTILALPSTTFASNRVVPSLLHPFVCWTNAVLSSLHQT